MQVQMEELLLMKIEMEEIKHKESIRKIHKLKKTIQELEKKNQK